jgi:choline transport protein
MVLAMVQLWTEDYTIRPWHQWLCYVATLWLAVAFNVFGTRFLPAYNRFLRKWSNCQKSTSPLRFRQVYFSVSTLFMTIVVILGCAAPHLQSSTWVFTDTANSNRSYDKWFLFILCLLNNTYGFMGTDAGAHLAEEIPSPSINTPKVIVSSPLSTRHCPYFIADNQKVYPVIIGLASGMIPI